MYVTIRPLANIHICLITLVVFGASLSCQEQNTSGQEQNTLKEAWTGPSKTLIGLMDTNENGQLDPDELKKDANAANAMKPLDLNKDGIVTLDEMASSFSEKFGPPAQELIKQKSSREKNIKRFASELVKRFDSNKDGLLDKDELGKMRRPPQSTDANGDGKMSSGEIAASMIESVKSKKSVAPSNGMLDYIDQLFMQYDTDNDEVLDVDEVAKMRRAPSWSGDTDKNNGFDRKELLAVVAGKTYEPLDIHTSATRTDEYDPKEKRKSTALKDASQGKQKMQRIIGEMKGTPQKRAKDAHENEKETPKVVSIEMHLLELSMDIAPERLRKLARKIRESDPDGIFKLIAEQGDEAILSHDQAFFDAATAGKFEYRHTLDTNAFGQSGGRGSLIETGLVISVTPHFEEEQLLLYTEINKTSLDPAFEKRNDGVHPVRRFRLETTLSIEAEKYVCDVFSDSGQQWLLITTAEY